MPRRDRDPRPPIEVIGGAPSAESLQDVSLGGGSGGQRRSGLGRGRTIAVGVVVAAALVALFASEGGGEDEAASSTTSTRRSTTTSTAGPTTSTTFAVIGPVTREPSGAVLVLADQSRRWHVLDLDTGDIRDLDLPAPMDSIYSAFVPVRGGVVTSDGTDAVLVPIAGGRSPTTLARGANSVFPAGRADRVWVAQLAEAAGEPGANLRLVDLNGKVLARRSSDYSDYYYNASEIGPVISDGGRTFVLDGDEPRSLGIGSAVGTGGSYVLMRTCDDAIRCSMQLVDVRTGARRELAELGSGQGPPQTGYYLFTPEGDIVEVAQPGRVTRITWVTSDGRVVARGEVAFGDVAGGGYGLGGDPAFLPNREGFVAMGGDGYSYVARVEGGGLRVQRLALPPVIRFDRMAVVRP